MWDEKNKQIIKKKESNNREWDIFLKRNKQRHIKKERKNKNDCKINKKKVRKN